MSQYVKKIRTESGDLQIDYTALANLPSAGSATQPVYISNGVPTKTTYTLGASVPSNAKFTDTTYTLSSFGITATAAELNYTDGVTSNIQTQLNGKAASSHNHAAGDITSGTLPIARGGTGATTVDGVLTNLGNIGKIYSSTPSTVSVGAKATKVIATLTLPAGSYVIIANSQWSEDAASSMYVHRITNSHATNPTIYGTNRGFMVGGGGTQTSAIISLGSQDTLEYEVYNGHSSSLNAEAISFSAIKIK